MDAFISYIFWNHWVGLDSSAIETWLHASVGWVSEHLDTAQRYLVSLFPSATAAGAGSVMGYRRKRGEYA
jgi:hypothetical protein